MVDLFVAAGAPEWSQINTGASRRNYVTFFNLRGSLATFPEKPSNISTSIPRCSCGFLEIPVTHIPCRSL